MRIPPPYPIEVPKEKIESQACCWKTEETIWRHIGTVDSLEAARYMVENDRISYKNADGVCYYLECEPLMMNATTASFDSLYLLYQGRLLFFHSLNLLFVRSAF